MPCWTTQTFTPDHGFSMWQLAAVMSLPPHSSVEQIRLESISPLPRFGWRAAVPWRPVRAGGCGGAAFQPDTFDAVVSAFGINHLPDPWAVALREAHRVLRVTGGRVAFRCGMFPNAPSVLAPFSPPFEPMDRWMSVFRQARISFCSAIPRRASSAARRGFDLPTVRQVPQVWRIADPDSLFDMIAGSSVRAGGDTSRPDSGRDEGPTRGAAEKSVEYEIGDHFELPMPAVIATAIKP